MKINLSIEADSPAEMNEAIMGLAVAIGYGGKPADPQPAAAKVTRSKSAETPTASQSSAPAAGAATDLTSTASAGTAALAPFPSAAGTATISQPVANGSAIGETETPVSEADIIAAANAAVATIGAAGPAKIKTYIGATYTKPDGTPGTIRLTRPEQRGALLADLQKIARGELVLP